MSLRTVCDCFASRLSKLQEKTESAGSSECLPSTTLAIVGHTGKRRVILVTHRARRPSNEGRAGGLCNQVCARNKRALSCPNTQESRSVLCWCLAHHLSEPPTSPRTLAALNYHFTETPAPRRVLAVLNFSDCCVDTQDKVRCVTEKAPDERPSVTTALALKYLSAERTVPERPRPGSTLS